MESLGQLLRAQREGKGLTIEDVRDATKITYDNLAALEADRFDRFPNKVYARAFLRDYSNYLGLDSPALLARYEEEWGTPPAPEQPAKSAGRSAWSVVGYVVLALLIIAALTAGGYFLFMSAKSSGKAHRTAHTSHHVAAPSEEAKPEPPPTITEEANVPEKPTSEAGSETTTAPPPPPADKLVLEVTTSREVWLGIVSDGVREFWNTMPGGVTKTYEATKTLQIKAGMAGAITVKLNGKDVGPLAPPKSIVNKTFTLQDIPKPTPVETSQPPPATTP